MMLKSCPFFSNPQRPLNFSLKQAEKPCHNGLVCGIFLDIATHSAL
ncbi:hypothetical protein FHW74_002762 [Atlantibacter sp. RC6]|nr:hypothetical protein [Atlantibacter sp. RC6]